MPSKTVPAPPSSSPAHPAGGSGEGQKDIAVSPSSSPARLDGGRVRAKSKVEREVNDRDSDGYVPEDLGDPNEIDPDQELRLRELEQ